MKHAEFIQPWQSKGRWYTLFIESTGSAHKLTTSDLAGVSVSGNAVLMPLNFHLLENVFDIHTVSPATAANLTKIVGVNAGGRQLFNLISTASYDYMYVHVYGYFDDVPQQASASVMSMSAIDTAEENEVITK